MRTSVACIDLFCGLGGLTHGLIKRKISVVKGIDLDSECKFPYESNNGAEFIEKDVSLVTGTELKKMFPKGKLRLLAGCAPCQPFSTYSRKSRRDGCDDKWNLVLEFGRLIREIQPELVTMENVPQLLDHSVFEDFLSSLEGYSVDYKVIECEKYGIPQSRRRLVLIASRLGAIKLMTPEEFKSEPATVHKAISHLPSLKAGECSVNDPLHRASKLSPLNLQRIRASKAGGTWRDWDKKLLASCHRRATGSTYPAVYGRMEWNRPAPTITTQCFGFGNGRFGHPEQDRAISLREAAILQTFPDNYKFVPPNGTVRFSTIGRLIGNAVPVRLGELVAESLVEHLVSIEDPKVSGQ